MTHNHGGFFLIKIPNNLTFKHIIIKKQNEKANEMHLKKKKIQAKMSQSDKELWVPWATNKQPTTIGTNL